MLNGINDYDLKVVHKSFVFGGVLSVSIINKKQQLFQFLTWNYSVYFTTIMQSYDLVTSVGLSGYCPDSLCNKRHELAENFLSLILINLVPKVASNCE